MSPSFAHRVEQALKGKILQLPKPLQLKDFRGNPAGCVADYIRATLTIDGRRFINQRFLVMAASRDVFIGQDFWVEHRAGLFPFNKTIQWPDDLPPLAYTSKPIMVPSGPPRPVDQRHQADVVRRDRLREKEDRDVKRVKIL